MEVKEISQAVIGRLPRYFRYLGELKDEGVERISSQEQMCIRDSVNRICLEKNLKIGE